MAAQILRAPARQAGIINAYSEPASLGMDRWLAMLAAAQAVGLPVVVMDIGTATTLDAVDRQGQHLGGQIFPGPQTMLESLGQAPGLAFDGDALALFSELKLQQGPGAAAGKDTITCILQGIRSAQQGALHQFVEYVRAVTGEDPGLVACGGGAAVILSQSDVKIHLDPWLVFKGMLISQDD